MIAISEDIMKRQGDFIGQVNNVLCFFRQQASAVKYRLFCSYCTSLYGCELWQLSHNKLAGFSTTWRKGVRKVWQLPTRVHCHLLPLLCRCLYQSKTKSASDLWNSYANASIVMLMSYDQWLTTLSHMVAITFPSVGMLCSAWTVTTVLLMIFCTARKLKMWFTFFI